MRQRCPWDREQSIASLGKHLVEEAYEALDAIERDDTGAIVDELGDLISQVLAIAVIGEEQQRFRVAQLFQWAADKLVRRHPHVYADATAATSAEVIENWNRIKQDERKSAGATSALDGIARAMPALARAEKLGSRARQAGMDWHDIHDVLAKVREEMDEVEGALAEQRYRRRGERTRRHAAGAGECAALHRSQRGGNAPPRLRQVHASL